MRMLQLFDPTAALSQCIPMRAPYIEVLEEKATLAVKATHQFRVLLLDNTSFPGKHIPRESGSLYHSQTPVARKAKISGKWLGPRKQ